MKRLVWCKIEYLYVDTIVSWTMYATVKTKANNKNSPTYSKSYSVASARIPPSIIKINYISSGYDFSMNLEAYSVNLETTSSFPV